MPSSLNDKIQRLMLPGLKRYILIVMIGMFGMGLGFLLLLGYHPLTVSGIFIRELLEHAADVLPYRISGIIVLAIGAVVVGISFAKIIGYVLGAYLPEDRESIPDVLYRKHRLETAPRVVVIGGGTGLSNLLRGLKHYTNNITAIVTVGDDGGSSGRLRQELGVLPPGDIRNCITALADEDKLVTELFRYRFESGRGLEGHSFGNLFLSAVCAITNGDMLEAARVASRVLNSCGQVLPATLSSMTLCAEFEDGREVVGESKITHANGGKIRQIRCQPFCPKATPESLQAILAADLIVLGPGSLYTSVIPNLLVLGVVEAIRRSSARKIYVCNVMTQPGETDNYTVTDHLEALLLHAQGKDGERVRLIDAIMINDEPVQVAAGDPCMPVQFDPERVRELGVRVVRRPLLSPENNAHHDGERLSQALMMWFYRRKKKKNARVSVVAPLAERIPTTV